MYCSNCGTEVPVDAIACGKCGWNPRKGTKYCWNCGTEPEIGAIMCVKCGAALKETKVSTEAKNNKILVGLIAIFFGWLGIHKFIMGYTNPGLIMCIGSVASLVVATLLAWLILPMVLYIVPFGMSVIGLIEGIIYLTKTDEEYQRIYVDGQKFWF
ncbi:MAG: TM2 domain-containing protein [Candidatus Cloacimonetes bacterium]|nr:TM2 domain-containing protein [Candidatus Cloacimonadota bacterium]